MGALTPQQLQMQRHQKIQAAKLTLEQNNGGISTINADKIQEWALLDIAESLHEIKGHLAEIRGSQHVMMKNDMARPQR